MLELPEVQLVRIWVGAAIARLRNPSQREADQRGEIAQTVIIVAILAAAAIAIATIIATKFKTKANDIPTD
jgi:hypothetical protein